MKLSGIFGPVTTPFTASGDLDRAAFEHNVRAHVAQGLDGIVAAGSTGEAPLLDESDRDALLEWARPLLGDRLLIAGIGGESTRITVKRARRAAERGAQAALVVAPHYFSSAMTEDALRSHYRRVADDSPIPIILYNIPKYMHFRLGGALVAEVAAHPNVIGIKDSAGERDSLAEYLRAQSDSFTVLTGSGQLFRTAVGMGARGGILAVALFVPELTLAVWDAARRGDPDADALQARLTPIARVIVGELGVPGVKAALDLVEMRGGPPRSPLMPLGAADLQRVRDLLASSRPAPSAR